MQSLTVYGDDYFCMLQFCFIVEPIADDIQICYTFRWHSHSSGTIMAVKHRSILFLFFATFSSKHIIDRTMAWAASAGGAGGDGGQPPGGNNKYWFNPLPFLEEDESEEEEEDILNLLRKRPNGRELRLARRRKKQRQQLRQLCTHLNECEQLCCESVQFGVYSFILVPHIPRLCFEFILLRHYDGSRHRCVANGPATSAATGATTLAFDLAARPTGAGGFSTGAAADLSSTSTKFPSSTTTKFPTTNA